MNIKVIDQSATSSKQAQNASRGAMIQRKSHSSMSRALDKSKSNSIYDQYINDLKKISSKKHSYSKQQPTTAAPANRRNGVIASGTISRANYQSSKRMSCL